jgi:glycosyltransferase involved in cell wall biosynthesis
MQSKELKIFIGPTEIGKIGGTLACAFREKGIKVTVVRNNPNPFQDGMMYDQTIQFDSLKTLKRRFMRLQFFIKILCQHNALIFLFGQTLLPNNLDLPFLKLFRKKTIMWFLGSDIISYEDVEKTKKKVGVKSFQRESKKESPEVMRRKIQMIRKIEKYVDHIIADPSIAHLLKRNYIGLDAESGIHIPIDIINIRYSNVPNPNPIIIHAPSNEEGKGTAYIIEAVKRLEKEGYSFDFRLCKDMSNTQVREILSEGDIAVDQLFSVGGGLFAVEAMAAGCAVLGGNIPELSGISNLPIIHTDTTNVYHNLKLLIEKPDLRQELGRKGRIYAERYHNHRKIAEDILRLLTEDKLGNKS